VGIPALTAHRCLFADGDVRGLRVLVHGGAGVVGRAAIMLAKWAGAWVATTVRDRADIDAAGDAGADVVINMLENDVAAVIKAATAGAGVDRIVEVDLLSNLDTDLASLAPGGVISTYAVDGVDDLASVPVFRAMRAGAAFRFVLVYTVPAPAKRAAVEDVTAWLAARGYRPRIGLTAPLDRIVEAHEALESRKVKGNILVRTQPIADFE
jgi:NADPH2:quinone reductase